MDPFYFGLMYTFIHLFEEKEMIINHRSAYFPYNKKYYYPTKEPNKLFGDITIYLIFEQRELTSI